MPRVPPGTGDRLDALRGLGELALPRAPAPVSHLGNFQSGALPRTQACSSNHIPRGHRPGAGWAGPAEGSWDLPVRMGVVVLEEAGHAGRRLGLQAMLLQEGAQNEVPGK